MTRSGTYEIKEVEGIPRGTEIIIELKTDCLDFSKKSYVEGVIMKYSNFVGFPIHLNDAKVNTVQPLWTKSKDQITEEQHKEFYQYITGFPNEPIFHLHYSVDSPIMIRSLFYVPATNPEKMSRERLDAGVNLYSRKVLIKPKAQELLPEWLRFVRGVCDSEDIPLNLSREILQDSALISKIRNTLTNRVLKWLADEANRDPIKYNKFLDEFEPMLEEGVVSDRNNKDKIAPLLRFESSATEEDGKTSLDDYLKRAKEGQKKIYYLSGSNRGTILASPYMEQFAKDNVEVLFITKPFGDYVMKNLDSFKNFEIVPADTETLDSATDQKEKMKALEIKYKDFVGWLTKTLTPKVYSVTVRTFFS